MGANAGCRSGYVGIGTKSTTLSKALDHQTATATEFMERYGLRALPGGSENAVNPRCIR